MSADPVFGLPVGDGPHDPDRIPSAFGGSPADRGSVTKIARLAGLPDGWADPGVTADGRDGPGSLTAMSQAASDPLPRPRGTPNAAEAVSEPSLDQPVPAVGEAP